MPNAPHIPLRERQAWPKLSQSLFPTAPTVCKQCGAQVTDADARGPRARTRWIEHDEWDRPTATVVVLCGDCAARLIEPHPRLYARVPSHKPLPGLMELCVGCRLLSGTRCTHPRAKANGGEGVAIAVAPPTRAFMDGMRGGRRAGWVEEIWPSAPSACDGREERENA